MKVTITLTKTLDDNWATPEEFAAMSDAQIIEMCEDDLLCLLEDCKLEVRRHE